MQRVDVLHLEIDLHLAMEKLAALGLVQVQPTRPKMFAALPPERVVSRIIEIARERADRFQVTGVRYSGELGHPFHVVDDETVVLPLDHPFVKESRFASLLVRDRELAENLAEGFQELWKKAMRNVREIQVDPRVPTA